MGSNAADARRGGWERVARVLHVDPGEFADPDAAVRTLFFWFLMFAALFAVATVAVSSAPPL